MPPQTRAAARAALTTFDALPLALALRIFALLPADARLLAAAVCRSWRAMLADPALWTRLDLSEDSGVRNPTASLLRAAAARAGGQLEALRISSYFQHELLAVLAANARTLGELSLCAGRVQSREAVEALLRAAPRLRILETGMSCVGEDALPVLRKEPPFGPLRLKRVVVNDIKAADWPALAAGLAAHTSLQVVCLPHSWPGAQAVSDAVVDALRSLPQLHTLSLCRTPASVLARLLACPELKSLRVYGDGAPLLDSSVSTALLCDALRANTRIDTVNLLNVGLWHDMDAAHALLATLQTHPSLKELTLSLNAVLPEHTAAAGAALGALIAHSPALEMLDISGCFLRDAGLGPIMDALPRARHLRKLGCIGTDMSEAFVRERLLHAVRACAPLRELKTDVDCPAVTEMQTLLQQRR